MLGLLLLGVVTGDLEEPRVGEAISSFGGYRNWLFGLLV